MDIIPYSQFERLRLADFYPDTEQICGLDDWEYLDEMWIGEGVGFTTFLQPHNRPGSLGSIELDMTDLPDGVAEAVLRRIHLPLAKGMAVAEIVRLLGAPKEVTQFVADRKAYDFVVGLEYPYLVSCTVVESEGLLFVGVARLDVIKEPGTLVRKVMARAIRASTALTASMRPRR